MKFQLILSSGIDKKKWDDTILTSDNCSVYALSWYLDHVADSWGGIISEEYSTILPLCFRKKFGINYIYQPFFTRNTAIYGNREYISELFSTLAELKGTYKFWDFCLEGILPPLEKCIYTNRIYQSLNLDFSYEELTKKYAGNLKRSIRDAKTAELKITHTNNCSVFTSRFKEYTSHRIKEFKERDYIKLEQLLELCKKHTEYHFLSVLKNEKELATAFICKSGSRFIYIEGYSSPEGRTMQAMHFLFDHFIETHCGKPYILDFGGSNVPGIAHFFHAFGATDRTYNHLYMNNLPPIIRRLK